MATMNYAFKTKILAALCFSLSYFSSSAQTGGLHAFQNLNMQYGARTMGLGGDAISIYDSDINLILNNPALMNPEMSGVGTLSQSIISSGANTGALMYGKQFNKTMTSAHFRYVSYGKMKRTDVNGTDLGTFTPGDFILGVSGQRAINERMSIGATLNFLYSQLDNYTSFGNSIDIAGIYRDPERNICIAGVVKNLGVQWKSYHGDRSPLPLEIQFGITHKVKHAPFRVSIVAQHLQKWDLSYYDPLAKDRVDPLSGDTIRVKKDNFAGKLARHGKIQLEILIGKKISVQTAFDYQRRKELAVVGRGGLAGFSFGTSLQLKRFRLDYGWYIYSVSGGQHGLSLSIPINRNK